MPKLTHNSPPWVGVSLMPEPEFLRAALPLFAADEIEGLEWSFDMGWGEQPLPDWIDELLASFAGAGRLLGHGVTYSLFTVGKEEQRQSWLSRLQHECARRTYEHVSEHFGFTAAGDFHRGAPLPVPLTPTTLGLGRDRLRRLANAAGRPVGVENLAFAFGLDDVQRQGEFLEQLLEPVAGFLLLDLHNIYCQSCNFCQTPEQLMAAYPLHRVRELHLSGGSWSGSPEARVRRDTHDGPVPEILFSLLNYALEKCPAVQAVIFEQLSPSLSTDEAATQYRSDFQRIRKTVHDFLPPIAR